MIEPQGKKEVREAVLVALVTTLITEGIPRLLDYWRERMDDANEKRKKKRKRKSK